MQWPVEDDANSVPFHPTNVENSDKLYRSSNAFLQHSLIYDHLGLPSRSEWRNKRIDIQSSISTRIYLRAGKNQRKKSTKNGKMVENTNVKQSYTWICAKYILLVACKSKIQNTIENPTHIQNVSMFGWVDSVCLHVIRIGINLLVGLYQPSGIALCIKHIFQQDFLLYFYKFARQKHISMIRDWPAVGYSVLYEGIKSSFFFFSSRSMVDRFIFWFWKTMTKNREIRIDCRKSTAQWRPIKSNKNPIYSNISFILVNTTVITISTGM